MKDDGCDQYVHSTSRGQRDFCQSGAFGAVYPFGELGVWLMFSGSTCPNRKR